MDVVDRRRLGLIPERRAQLKYRKRMANGLELAVKHDIVWLSDRCDRRPGKGLSWQARPKPSARALDAAQPVPIPNIAGEIGTPLWRWVRYDEALGQSVGSRLRL